MKDKILIVGISEIDKLDIAKELIRRNDNLSIIPHFTTNPEMSSIENDNYIQYIKNNVINLAYKNNSLLYIITSGYISTGITADDYYNNDVAVMNVEEFNQIPDRYFNVNAKYYNNIIIWVDTKTHKHISQNELTEIKYLQERLDNINYMYFLDSNIDTICSTILNYIDGDEETRKSIIIKNT